MGVFYLCDCNKIIGFPIVVFDLAEIVCIDQFLLQSFTDMLMHLFLTHKGEPAIYLLAILLIVKNNDRARFAFLCSQKM